MQLNYQIDATTTVTLHGQSYPVTVAGSGIPCLSIGTGTLGQLTLSPQFKKIFRVYSTDLYFDQRYALTDLTSLTLDRMLDDIAAMAQQLGLTKFVLFGFSAFGLIALEFAKKYPTLVAGVIMVGTPPNANAAVGERNNDYFNQHAEPERKKIDAERRAQAAQKDFSGLDFAAQFLYNYVYVNAPRYWHQPDFDCSELWRNLNIDRAVEYLFTAIFPQLDVFKQIDQVRCPVFLAAGRSDYDCCPWRWQTAEKLPAQMTIVEFWQSGHWPHYEEQPAFDAAIANWAQAQLASTTL